MKTITIRNVPDEDYRALRVRAAQNGRSMEAELRALIEHARAANPPLPPRARKSRAEIAAAFGELRRYAESLVPSPSGLDAVEELFAERRADAARDASNS